MVYGPRASCLSCARQEDKMTREREMSHLLHEARSTDTQHRHEAQTQRRTNSSTPVRPRRSSSSSDSLDVPSVISAVFRRLIVSPCQGYKYTEASEASDDDGNYFERLCVSAH